MAALGEDEREALTNVVRSWLPVSYAGLIPRLELWITERDEQRLAAAEALADEWERIAEGHVDRGATVLDGDRWEAGLQIGAAGGRMTSAADLRAALTAAQPKETP